MLRAPSGASWEFDTFRLMAKTRLLLSSGAAVPLMSKGFDTLVLLVENRDRVVSKDELLQAVWPDVVVEEANLTQQIFLLRKALGDSAQRPRYIVTVPGHGYRFAAPVREISADAPSLAEDGGAATRPQAGPPWMRRVMATMILGGILAALAIVFAFRPATRRVTGTWLDPAGVRIQKLTESGRATHATMSPDGRYVAYVENEGDQYSLHVQQLATGGRTQVIPGQPEMLGSPTFSPDGGFLYFTRNRIRGGANVLSRIPAIGGPETAVLDDVDTSISFSPDGRQFVFERGADTESHIVVADVGGGAQRILATRTVPLAFSAATPAWSPDGKWLAVSAADLGKGGRSSIVLLPAAGGDGRDLYATDDRIGALRWLPDGSGLLTVVSGTIARQFAPWQGNDLRLSGGAIWRIAYPDGGAERLTPDLADYDLCCVDVAGSGRLITGLLNSVVSDLWIAPADRLDALRQITWGNPVVRRHGWLPDNDTIVYHDLSGGLNAVHKDGRTFRLAVPDGHKVVGGVSACGDGRHVVFQAVPGNSIWRVTPTSGGATRLTSGHHDTNPVCSPDGKWVVYLSMREGVPSTWRVPIEGGEPSPLVAGEAFEALPSPSGRLIYYSAWGGRDGPLLRRLRWFVNAAADGKQLFTLDTPKDWTAGTTTTWAPDESGLDYVVTRNGVSNVWRQPLTRDSPVQLTHFTTSEIFGFAWSPDAKWLSLSGGTNRSDVVLLSRER